MGICDQLMWKCVPSVNTDLFGKAMKAHKRNIQAIREWPQIEMPPKKKIHSPKSRQEIDMSLFEQ